MPKAKPLPTDADFEAAVLEVCREWSRMDLMDPCFLRQQAHYKIMRRFPRRMKQREIFPRVLLAVLTLLAAGRLRRFSIADKYHNFAYAFVNDREQVMDMTGIDQ